MPARAGCHHTGDVTDARALGEQAWAIAADSGDRQAAAGALQVLARLSRVANDDRSSSSGGEMCQNSLRLPAALGDVPGFVSCLEDAATLFVDRGWFAPAGRVLGAAEALRATGGYARPPVDRDDHLRTVGAVADVLGADYERVRMEGRTLSWDDAVATDMRERRPKGIEAGALGGLDPSEREVDEVGDRQPVIEMVRQQRHAGDRPETILWCRSWSDGNIYRYTQRMTQIAVKLPDGLVRQLDELVAQGLFSNRSSAVRRAVEIIVSGKRRDALEEAYANGYRHVPESESELAEAKRMATQAIEDEPWEKWW